MVVSVQSRGIDGLIETICWSVIWGEQRADSFRVPVTTCSSKIEPSHVSNRTIKQSWSTADMERELFGGMVTMGNRVSEKSKHMAIPAVEHRFSTSRMAGNRDSLKVVGVAQV